MANNSKVVITGNGDSESLYESKGVLDLEFEGYYAIQLEGTLDAGATITPWIKFGSSNSYDQPDVPGLTDGTKFVMPTHGKHFIVPGNIKVKFVTAGYGSSANLVVSRTRVAKG